MIKLLTAMIAAAIMPSCLAAQTAAERIGAIVADKPATVGVAWITDGVEHAVNNAGDYPMMSVFKLHGAIALLRQMECCGTRPDTIIKVEAMEMMKDTYSPLLKVHPEGSFTIRLDSLLAYSIALSDNNACDIIMRMAGGTAGVNAEMRAIGLKDYAITETEATMHADPTRSYNNRSTPLSVATLFMKLYEGGILGEPYASLLKDILLSTSTGQDKIKAALGPSMTLAHKTGTGFRLPDGTLTADNDAGVITLPDGRRIYIAVLIRDSRLGSKANAALMAEIARTVIDAYK